MSEVVCADVPGPVALTVTSTTNCTWPALSSKVACDGDQMPLLRIGVYTASIILLVWLGRQVSKQLEKEIGRKTLGEWTSSDLSGVIYSLQITIGVLVSMWFLGSDLAKLFKG